MVVSMKVLRTVPQVFERLGGDQGVAKITQVHWKQAYHWRQINDQIPAPYYVAIQRALKRKGFEASPNCFAMKGLAKRAA